MPLRVQGRPPSQLVDGSPDLGEVGSKRLLKGSKAKAQPLGVGAAILPDSFENRGAKLHERFYVAANHREPPSDAGQLNALRHLVPLVLNGRVNQLGNRVKLLLQQLGQLELTCDERGEPGWLQGVFLDKTPQVEFELEGLDVDLRVDGTQTDF